jgi:hypothetical protein
MFGTPYLLHSNKWSLNPHHTDHSASSGYYEPQSTKPQQFKATTCVAPYLYDIDYAGDIYLVFFQLAMYPIDYLAAETLANKT